MENNNHKKRKVMLIAAFAVAVIALAGIGYATGVGYRGTTVNTGNTADGKYITVTQGGSYTGIFNPTDAVKIDTYTDNGYRTTPIFSLADSAAIGATGYKGVQVGQDLVLTITGSSNAALSSTYTVTVKTAADALSGTTGGWSYILSFQGTSGDPVYIYNTSAGFDDTTTAITTTGTITVKLYIASQTVFEDIDTPAEPLVTESYVPNVGEASGTVSPLTDGKLFNGISVVFTVEGEQ